MNRLTSHIAKLVVIVAALAAVGGGTAIAAKLITGKQIKNGTITGKDLKGKSIATKHLSASVSDALKGAAGEQGAQGEQGPQGERGPSTAYAKRTEAGKAILDDASSIVQTLSVPNGAYVLQAKATVLNTGKDAKIDCRLGVLRGLEFEALDQVDHLTLTPNGEPGDTVAVSLLAATTVDNGSNTVELRCTPDVDDTLNARDRTIIATQVAELK